MENSKIEWCDHTFNPWIGCSKVSPGCAHCYAEAMSRRYGKDLWGPGKERQLTSEAYWKAPYRWDREAALAGIRPRVFCASMADVFDDDAPIKWREDLFWLIERTRHLDWLILTKRPHYIRPMLEGLASDDCWKWSHEGVVLPNVWFGVSVEDQARSDERIPILASIPAKVRFLSVEPLLENIVLYPLNHIHWVIVGGESGRNCRPMDPCWADGVQGQCAAWDIPFFMKQLGGHPDKRGRMEDFPDILRIREFPSCVVKP
jgi:protein gp37